MHFPYSYRCANFLLCLLLAAPAFAQTTPQRVAPLDDGRVVLTPEAAEFHGGELRINPDNFCIAWWSQADDFVAWNFTLPAAQKYEVWLEWSIADELAGNSFVVECGEQRLEGKIGKSGGWTSFQRAKLGVLDGRAGDNRVQLKALAPLRGELADVRSMTLNPLGASPPPGSPEIPPRSPAASLAAIQVHPALQVDLVAAEPLVCDPIAIAWGADLKLWVVEMGDYPLGADGKERRGGRIKFLEDTNADGYYDRATVFLDKLNFPTGVLPWRKGVLVTCAPEIFYAEDTDGDGSADLRKPLFTGFPERNQQHRVNGLRWGLDNWIYCANGDGGVGGETAITSVLTGRQVRLGSRDLRFRPETGELEPQAGPSQFGRTCDDWGNWFGANNAQPLYHFALDESYLSRNPRLTVPDARRHLFSVSGPFYTRAPAIAFHGEPQSLAAGPRETGLSSACSPLIYRDELLGADFVGNAFVCDPVTNLIHRRILTAEGSTFASARAKDEPTSEFFASADPWTRPTMVQTGPDGSLYVVDMYRLYIEHPQWIHPSVLSRADLRAGADRGRIYRISPRRQKPRAARRLDQLDLPALTAALDSPSGWQRDTVQQLLIDRGDPSAAPALRQLALQATRPQTRLQALATLAGLEALDDALLLTALGDSHPAVRRHAVRLAEPRLNAAANLSEAVVKLADDPDPLVRMQAAYSLGAWENPSAGACLGRMIAAEQNDPWMAAAILSSAPRHSAALLEQLFSAEPISSELLSRVIAACSNSDDALAKLLVQKVGSTADKGATESFVLLGLLLDRFPADHSIRRQLIDAGSARFEQARKLADDPDAPEPQRAAAVKILAYQAERRAMDLDRLVELISPAEPQSVAQAALDRLMVLGDGGVGPQLAERLKHNGPKLRSELFKALLSRHEWSEALLAELQRTPALIASLDASRRQQLLQHPSPQARERAAEVLGALGADDRQTVLDRYAKSAETLGDPQRGQVVFAKNCAACHRMGEAGHEVGPNLAGLRQKSPQALLDSILHPNRAVEDKFVAYAAILNDGRSVTGLIVSETGNSLTFASGETPLRTIPRSDLDSLNSTGRSLMPEGFEQSISQQAMSDLLAYLTQTPPQSTATVAADQKGVLNLLPSHARFQGTHVGINHEADCIAWLAAGESAAWTLEVPRDGSYEVWIEWAQIDEYHGNLFVIHTAEAQLEGTFNSTQGWDRYHNKSFGTLPLRAGRVEIILKPHGAVRGELADIRAIRLKAPAK